MVNATIRNVKTHLTIKKNNCIDGDHYFNTINEETFKENAKRCIL